MPDEGDVSSVTGTSTVSPDPTTGGPDDEDPGEAASASPEMIEVTSLAITYANKPNNDFTANVGEKVPLRARMEPVGIEEPVIWTSSNTSVFQVVTDNLEGTSALVTAIGKGTATLTISVGGKEATCTVRVN